MRTPPSIEDCFNRLKTAGPAVLLAPGVLIATLGRRLSIELIVLTLVVASVLVGWLSPAEALAGFGNPAVITVVAMFVISAALVRSGALEPIAALTAAGRRPCRSARGVSVPRSLFWHRQSALAGLAAASWRALATQWRRFWHPSSRTAAVP